MTAPKYSTFMSQSSDGPDPNRVVLLEEMVREAERVIDGQFRAMTELDGKAENLLRLIVLGLIFGLSLGSVAASQYDGALANLTIIVTALALLANIAGLYFVVHSYYGLGARRYAQTTPNIPGLLRRLKVPLIDVEIHLEGLLMGYAQAQAANHDVIEETVARRRKGVRLLAWAAMPIYVSALVLMTILAIG